MLNRKKMPKFGPNATYYEREPRKHGGNFMHHAHEFPIKNGLTRKEGIKRNLKLAFKELLAK